MCTPMKKDYKTGVTTCHLSPFEHTHYEITRSWIQSETDNG